MDDRMLKIYHEAEERNREDQAKYQSLKDWSRHRCRLQSELSRKIEATKEYSMLTEGKIHRAKTETTEKFINLSKEEPAVKAPY